MSLRSRSHVKAIDCFNESQLFIHNFIISLLNIIVRPILMVWKGIDLFHTTCVSDALAN